VVCGQKGSWPIRPRNRCPVATGGEVGGRAGSEPLRPFILPPNFLACVLTTLAAKDAEGSRWVHDVNTVEPPPDALRAFCRSFYQCLHRRADALFELTDAILSTDAAAPSAVQLRLARARVVDLRLPWERPYDRGRLTPVRVHRVVSSLLMELGTPPRAPEPCGVGLPAGPKAASLGERNATRPSKRPPESTRRGRTRGDLRWT
jgi:hypothetical protein